MDELIENVNFRIEMGGEKVAIAIAQEHGSGKVLMVAFMNKEAVRKTLETGKMHYYSTSRKKLWLKGETSGHVQHVKEVYLDCDGDALLFKVEQESAACHEGYKTCFFRRLKDGELEISEEKIFDPEKVYRQ